MTEPQPKPQSTRLFTTFDLFTMLAMAVGVGLLAFLTYRSALPATPAQIAYLYPASGGDPVSIPNIWVTHADGSGEPRQLTDERAGVYDFAVSPDGQQIVYSTRNPQSRILDLYLIEMANGETRQLTDCATIPADCYRPIFHPTEPQIIFEQLGEVVDEHNHGTVPTLWTLAINAPQATMQPLRYDHPLLGSLPQFANSGDTLAFYQTDIQHPGVIVMQLGNDNITQFFVPSNYGAVGALSPDGQRLVYPVSVDDGFGFITQQFTLDLTETNPSPQPLLGDWEEGDVLPDDVRVGYHPNDGTLTLARQYTRGDEYTPGYQLYQVEVATGAIEPLLVDADYGHYSFEWEANGERLVVQRIDYTQDTPRPQIWMYDVFHDDLYQLADGAYFPHWLNAPDEH